MENRETAPERYFCEADCTKTVAAVVGRAGRDGKEIPSFRSQPAEAAKQITIITIKRSHLLNFIYSMQIV